MLPNANSPSISPFKAATASFVFFGKDLSIETA